MTKIPFKYYMHDDYDGEERADWIAEQTGLPTDHPVFEKISRPFYEVTLNCLLDTDTGEVELVSTEL